MVEDHPEYAMRFPADDMERRKWQNPEVILSCIGLKEGDIFVDVGCGEGFFALPAARIVGEKGKVYGIDINPRAIEHLIQEAASRGLGSLEAITSEAEKTIICTGCADVVFYGICLHDFSEPEKVLACARYMVNESGMLIDLDWKPIPTPFGPPMAIRFPEEKAKAMIEQAGFRIQYVQEAGPWHYCIMAEPVT